MHIDGIRDLYKGFGISILTYTLSDAVWWASYPIAYGSIRDGIGSHLKEMETMEVGDRV